MCNVVLATGLFGGEAELLFGLRGKFATQRRAFVVSAEGKPEDATRFVFQIDGKLTVMVRNEVAFAEAICPLSLVAGRGLLEDLKVVGEGWIEAKTRFEEDRAAKVRDAVRGGAVGLQVEFEADVCVGRGKLRKGGGGDREGETKKVNHK